MTLEEITSNPALKPYEYFRTDRGVLYKGECLEVMAHIPDKSVDLVLTDPPYGINADKGVGGFGSAKNTAKKYADSWDNKTPDKIVFDEILRVSEQAVIFGGNFFSDKLPIGTHWIVWDKCGSIAFNNPFGDAELAWTNLPKKSIKKYTIIQQGFVSEERERFHPTQKPVKLFKQILEDWIDKSIILDCYFGSGTTGVAAEKLGRYWIGCEIDEKYCAIAKARIQAENAQIKMF